jgi:predicted HTH transcriptional regulator
MSLFDPRLQFEHPDWNVLTAPRIEGQWYERKASSEPEKIAEAISAFANSNPDGGLLVLGLENNGQIRGLDYLGQDKISQLQKSCTLVTQQTDQKLVSAQSIDGRQVTLLFIYTPFSPNRVIETSKGKAFKRVGDSTIELKNEERRELEYTKGQIQLEDEVACSVNFNDIDADVFKEFVNMVKERDALPDSVSDESILCNRSLAILKQGAVQLTNAGVLLFHKDPRRYVAGAYIRFLRYAGKEIRTGHEQNLVKDEVFWGPIPRIVLRVREYLKSQLKEFNYLGTDGRFVTEPEYPEEAWDEAVVNALVHRSYSYRSACITIRLFDNRLEVISPGDYPKGIRPEDFRTNPMSNPRNPHIMDAMRGLRFVKMISEGTKRMIRAMEDMSLPPPEFSPAGGSHVTVTLHNDIERRTAERWGASQAQVTAFANLFRLETVGPPQSGPVPDEALDPPSAQEIRQALSGALQNCGYIIDSFAQNIAVDFRQEHVIPALRTSKLVSLYPAIEFRVFEFGAERYLCVDLAVDVRNRATLDQLLTIVPNMATRHFGKGFYREAGVWNPCFIREVGKDSAIVEPLGSPDKRISVDLKDALPSLPSTWLSELLAKASINVDLFREIKRLSLSDVTGAARQRSELTVSIVKDLAQRVFPLRIRSYQVQLSTQPRKFDDQRFRLANDLVDTEPVFDTQGRRRPTVVQGLTELGAYQKPQQLVPIALLCTPSSLQPMQSLIDVLSRGSMRYQGLERTFAIKFGHPILIVADSCEDYVSAVKRYHERREEGIRPFFLVYAPERGYSRADHHSPYYEIKHYLLEKGYPSQMVDEDTLASPRFKELNLALDIFAKNGFVPWVLDEGLPGADLFVGLSYSSIRTEGRLSRVLAYINVFDQYGRWQYYKGNSVPLPFSERNQLFRKLITDVVSEYQNRNLLQRIHVHYDFKLKREDQYEIAQGVLEVAPEAEVSFVYVNTHTPVRLYDSRADGDGSLARGSYVITSPNQFYISTTGFNPLGQKALGTPMAIEVTVHRINAKGDLDLHNYAQHTLSLTKLNWASSRTFCHEPITIKYAGDIAYLMNVFMSAFGKFNLHPELERTAWFL